MNKNTEKMFLTLGWIALLYFGYNAYTKSQQAAPVNLPPGGTPSTGTPPITTQTAIPAPPPSLSPTPASAPGIDPTIYATVMQWVNEDGQPPVLAFGQAAVPSEFNGMYQIISTNGWGQPQYTDFWNNLRNKYDPQHKYW